jgi:hypothetical protein
VAACLAEACAGDGEKISTAQNFFPKFSERKSIGQK